MKSITITIKIPKCLQPMLKQMYTEKELEKEFRSECLELIWDIFHALNRYKEKIEKEKAA